MPYKYCTDEIEESLSIHDVLTELNIPKNLIKKKRFWNNLKGENRHIEDLEKIPANVPLFIFIPKMYHAKVNFAPFKIKMGKIQTQYYFVKEGDNFKHRILYKGIGIPYRVLDDQGYYDKIVSWNDHIEDLNKIQPGQRLYVEYPKLYEQKCRLTSDMIREVASIPKTETSIKTQKPSEKFKLRYSVFYASSVGSYTESVGGSDTSAGQNSPITVGATVSTSRIDGIAYNGSVYVSKLSDFLYSDGSEIATNPEFGFTAHRSHALDSFQFYYGVDYENFNKLNITAVSGGTDSVEVENLSLAFATFGVAKKLSLFKSDFYFKASISQTIYSNAYTGNKLLLFAFKPLTPKWGITSFVKSHQLSEDSYLQILRYGAGVSYSF